MKLLIYEQRDKKKKKEKTHKQKHMRTGWDVSAALMCKQFKRNINKWVLWRHWIDLCLT